MSEPNHFKFKDGTEANISFGTTNEGPKGHIGEVHGLTIMYTTGPNAGKEITVSDNTGIGGRYKKGATLIKGSSGSAASMRTEAEHAMEVLNSSQAIINSPDGHVKDGYDPAHLTNSAADFADRIAKGHIGNSAPEQAVTPVASPALPTHAHGSGAGTLKGDPGSCVTNLPQAQPIAHGEHAGVGQGLQHHQQSAHHHHHHHHRLGA